MQNYLRATPETALTLIATVAKIISTAEGLEQQAKWEQDVIQWCCLCRGRHNWPGIRFLSSSYSFSFPFFPVVNGEWIIPEVAPVIRFHNKNN